MRNRKWIVWLLGVPLALVVLVSAGTWVYINVIREDAPERLSLEDAPVTDDGAADDGATGTSAPAGGVASATGIDGTWRITSGSQAGYRVKEILNGQSVEAVGRTDDVAGEITLAGTTATAGRFTVDMTTVTSDESRRDGQFRGRIMDVGTHPTATFVLTSPIDFGNVPEAGGSVAAEATGDLTLKGVTRKVTFDVDAQRAADTIRVAGSIPVVFADYGIDNPSGGPAQVGDEGELEFLLVLGR